MFWGLLALNVFFLYALGPFNAASNLLIPIQKKKRCETLRVCHLLSVCLILDLFIYVCLGAITFKWHPAA